MRNVLIKAKEEFINELTRYNPISIITIGSINRSGIVPNDIDILIISESDDIQNRFRVNSQLLVQLPSIYFNIASKHRLYTGSHLPLMDVFIYNPEEIANFYTSLSDGQFYHYLTTSPEVKIEFGENYLGNVKRSSNQTPTETVAETWTMERLKELRISLIRSAFNNKFNPERLEQEAEYSKVVAKRFLYHLIFQRLKGEQPSFDVRSYEFKEFLNSAYGDIYPHFLDGKISSIDRLYRTERFAEDCLNLLA